MAQLRREDIDEIVLQKGVEGLPFVVVWSSISCPSTKVAKVNALDKPFSDYKQAEAYAWQLAARFGMEVTVR